MRAGRESIQRLLHQDTPSVPYPPPFLYRQKGQSNMETLTPKVARYGHEPNPTPKGTPPPLQKK